MFMSVSHYLNITRITNISSCVVRRGLTTENQYCEVDRVHAWELYEEWVEDEYDDLREAA